MLRAMFKPEVYRDRRAALIAALRSSGIDSGYALFPGNRDAPINYPDNCSRFRQDSSFLYFFGIAEPGLWAVLDIASGGAALYADELSEHMLVWTGPRPSPSDWLTLSGMDAAHPGARLAEHLRSYARSKARLLYLPPYRADTRIELAELMGLPLGAVEGGASLPLINAVIALREIKSPLELKEISQAVDISIAMHKAVIAAARPGMSEAELMAIATERALAGGGATAFQPIATTRGAVLHNHAYDARLGDSGLFLLDAGAETPEGYAGDLTSTFPIAGVFDQRQAAIYDLVLKAGEAAAAALRPGRLYRDAHFAAAKAIAFGLRDLGLMRGDMDEAVEAGAHALFFPHGVGHQMGLDVHDMEALGEDHVGYGSLPRSAQFGLRSLRMAKPVRPGMVLTVEPGIYFIEGLIKSWSSQGKFRDFIAYPELELWLDAGGYRNEEDWVVTDSGAARLGGEFDKSAAAMQSLRLSTRR
jgi:Xaa-Pro aminopeptidase